MHFETGLFVAKKRHEPFLHKVLVILPLRREIISGMHGKMDALQRNVYSIKGKNKFHMKISTCNLV